MNRTDDNYQSLARAYVDGVRGLFTADGKPMKERGGIGAVSTEALEQRASALLPTSEALTEATAVKVHSEITATRAEGQIQLLAKATADLEVSEKLLKAAQEEERRSKSTATTSGTQRSVSLEGVDDENLDVLLDIGKARPRQRETIVVTDHDSAVQQVSERVDNTLKFIPERTVKMGQDALGGIITLGLAKLASQAAAVGLEIAKLIGVGEQVSKLYQLVRDYALQAYNALLSALGEGMIKQALEKAKEFLDRLQGGELFGNLLEKLYDTKSIKEELSAKIQSSTADVDHFVKAIEGVGEINDLHKITSDRVGKATQVLGILTAVPFFTQIPNIGLLFAAAFLIIGGFAIFLGADYLDIDKLKMEAGVDGVRKIVTKELG